MADHELIGTIEIYHESNPSNPRRPYAALAEDMTVRHGGTPGAAARRLLNDHLSQKLQLQVGGDR